MTFSHIFQNVKAEFFDNNHIAVQNNNPPLNNLKSSKKTRILSRADALGKAHSSVDLTHISHPEWNLLVEFVSLRMVISAGSVILQRPLKKNPQV